MDMPELTETQAFLLRRLGRGGDPDAFLHPRQAGRDEVEDHSRQMTRLEELGLVEHRVIGARVRHWRLTAAGWAAMPRANAVALAAYQARVAAWEREHLVHGRRGPGAAGPLTARQQRAWVQGWLLEQALRLPAPDDAPAEVRERFEVLREEAVRKLKPFFPHGDPPEPVVAPAARRPRP